MSLPLLPPHPTIVILGAGFGGVFTARCLDAMLKRVGVPIARRAEPATAVGKAQGGAHQGIGVGTTARIPK